MYATKVVTEENAADLSHGNALQLAVCLVEGVADVLGPGVTQQAIPALLASSFAGLVKTLPLEVWQHGPLTAKCIAILVALLSFPPRTSALFLENVAGALVELTTQSLLSTTAPLFASHLSTIAGACVSNFLPPSVRDLLSTTFLSVARISLPADQAGRVISDMVSSLASRIVQHTNTTHTVSHEATLEVVADVQIIDSLIGSKSKHSPPSPFSPFSISLFSFLPLPLPFPLPLPLPPSLLIPNCIFEVPLNEQLITNLTQLLETVTQRAYAKDGAAVIDAVCRVCTTLLSLPNYPASHAKAVAILVATYVKTGQAAPLKALAYAISPNKGKNAAPSGVAAAGGALEQVLAQVIYSAQTPPFFWMLICKLGCLVFCDKYSVTKYRNSWLLFLDNGLRCASLSSPLLRLSRPPSCRKCRHIIALSDD